MRAPRFARVALRGCGGTYAFPAESDTDGSRLQAPHFGRGRASRRGPNMVLHRCRLPGRRRRTWRPPPMSPSASPQWSWRPRSLSHGPGGRRGGGRSTDPHGGDEVELVVDTLYSEDDLRLTCVESGARSAVSSGRAAGTAGLRMHDDQRVAVLGAGITSGQMGAPSSSRAWRRPGTALAHAGLGGREAMRLRGGKPIRKGYRFCCPGATCAQAQGGRGRQRGSRAFSRGPAVGVSGPSPTSRGADLAGAVA